MKKTLRRQVLLVCLLAQLSSAGAGSQPAPPSPPPGLEVRQGELFKAGHRYRGVGANYFDLFLRVLAEPTNTASLDGLEKLSHAGIPFVRFATMFGAQDMRFYFERREEYLRRLDLVVRQAERRNIGLIPSLNWTFDLSELAGEPRDQWGDPQSKTIRLMRQYVADIVGRYKDSPALWGWEFGNEPSLSADLPNAAQFRKKDGTARDDLTSAHVVVAVTEFAREVKRLDASRPIFSGNSHPRICAWHNTRERSWQADTREQFREILRRDNPLPLNTICIHVYGNAQVRSEMGAWAADRVEWLATARAVARDTGRPLFVGEFGLPGTGDQAAIRATFEELLHQMEQAGVDLAAFWVFDLAPQSDSWSVGFDNSRAYMLQLTAEANRRWNQAALASEGRGASPHR